MTFLELIIVVSLWTLGGATEVTAGALMKNDQCLNGYKLTIGVLWELQTPTVGVCAALCAQQDSCATFTFDGSACRGHSFPVTSQSPSSTSSAGARAFVKTGTVPSYLVAVQSPGGYGYGNPVQFPDNVNISTMSRLCFSVRACRDAFVLLTADPWTNTSKLYDSIIGGWGNSKSVIRISLRGTTVATKQHSTGPLSCSQYRRFYLSWEKFDTLEVGAQRVAQPGGCLIDEPFMSYTNPQPFRINYVFLTSFQGEAPSWKLHGCRD